MFICILFLLLVASVAVASIVTLLIYIDNGG